MAPIDALLDRRRVFLALLAGYFSLQLVLRLLLPDSLDLDEAEQVFQSQWWLLGYGPQPPLYNWIQQLFLTLFGDRLIALALLKNLLLCTTWMLTYAVAQRCLGSVRLAALATLSLALIPQISWESQRDLTHSVLVTTLAVATLWQGLRLLDRPTPGNYLLLGLVIGLGCNAKYSYLLFIFTVSIAVLSLADARRQLWRPGLLLTAALALLLVLPHWWWLLNHLDLASESTLAKLMRPAQQDAWQLRWEGLLSLLNASLQFLALFLLVFAGLFWRSGARAVGAPGLAMRLLERYFLVLAIVFLLFILVTGANFIKDRWMQPLLVLLPVLALSYWPTASAARQRAYAGIALTVLALIPLLLGLRVLAVDITDRPERLNIPFASLAAQLSDERPAVLVTDRVRTAGNLRFQFPQTPVLAAERPDLGDWSVLQQADVWLVWDATEGDGLPTDLAAVLQQLQPDMRVENLSYRDFPYHFSTQQDLRFGLARLVP